MTRPQRPELARHVGPRPGPPSTGPPSPPPAALPCDSAASPRDSRGGSDARPGPPPPRNRERPSAPGPCGPRAAACGRPGSARGGRADALPAIADHLGGPGRGAPGPLPGPAEKGRRPAEPCPGRPAAAAPGLALPSRNGWRLVRPWAGAPPAAAHRGLQRPARGPRPDCDARWLPAAALAQT